MWCIPKHVSQQFLDKIRSGEITPEKLISMSSKERNEYFSKIFGDVNAPKVNSLFESKLLLKGQQQGIINWAQKIGGLKPEMKSDLLSRVNKMDKILTPETEGKFLADLAEHKLGATVTMKQAGDLMELARVANDKKPAVEKMYADKPDYDVSNETSAERDIRMEYGRARDSFNQYYSDLKTETVRKEVKEYFNPKNWAEGISNVAGFSKAMIASLDNSVIGRQGWRTLTSSPEIWLKNSKQSFVDIVQTFGGKNVMAEVRADILSRPNAMNGLYKKQKLAVGVVEEMFPTHIPSQVPVLGKAFKASETAFTAWQYRTRADVFDKVVDIANKSGASIEGLGSYVNALTGRGNLGTGEASLKALNNILFSPRFIASHFQVMTAAVDPNVSPLVRKLAAVNMAKNVIAMASVLGIAKALDPDSVEFDPRSSDFGKVKVGNTRFDVTGGAASLYTLIARIATSKTKNTRTGILSQLNTGDYGSATYSSVISNFLKNKTSPLARAVIDIAEGKNFKGEKVDLSAKSLAKEAVGLVTPIPLSNVAGSLNDPKAAPLVATVLLDSLGIGTNTYSSNVNWNSSSSKELKAFKEKVGEKIFNKANDDFNARWDARLDVIIKDEKYKQLTNERKQDLLTKEKDKIKDKILHENKFWYHSKTESLPRIK